MHYKKLLATAVFTLGVWMSAGVGAQTWNPQNNPVITADVNGTNYDFSYLTGSFTDNLTLLQSQPWWGNYALAGDFATAVGSHLGFTNTLYSDQRGPYFVFETVYGGLFDPVDYSRSSFFYGNSNSVICCGALSVNQSITYAVATVVPEMDASLIPQVGLLLGCLFFLFGRKKECTESLMTA